MFNEILEGIVERTNGGVGAVLMGYDGIAIEQYFFPCEDVDFNTVAVEYANVLKEVRKTAEILNTGLMEEVSIKTKRFYVVMRILNDEYFIALILDCDGNFGKGRYLLNKEAPRLREALE